MPSRSELRARLRARRRALNPAQRKASALALSRKLLAHPLFRRATRIACYLPVDGEMDTAPLLQRAWSMGKQIYLPVLTASGALWFAPYSRGGKMRGNCFGIPEPVCHPRARRSGRQLDLILAPLVGFDRNGNRLGMGGGYYDRSFAFLKQRHYWVKPRLLGLAYEFQRVAKLASHPWDVPLSGVVTEQQIYWV
ncbi:MAG: 5-formyltetrahydrofolate cyclo-ligase [Gammaproteobacteria bacterium]